MEWILIIIVGIVTFFVILSMVNKKERERKDEFGDRYNKLSDEEKALMSKEEYVNKLMQRAKLHEYEPIKNYDVIDKPVLIDCPACGNKVSNKAKSCPKCGHPIDTKVYCPNCGSKNVSPLSNSEKSLDTAIWGVYSTNTVMSKYKCKDCGHKF